MLEHLFLLVCLRLLNSNFCLNSNSFSLSGLSWQWKENRRAKGAQTPNHLGPVTSPAQPKIPAQANPARPTSPPATRGLAGPSPELPLSPRPGPPSPRAGPLRPPLRTARSRATPARPRPAQLDPSTRTSRARASLLSAQAHLPACPMPASLPSRCQPGPTRQGRPLPPDPARATAAPVPP